MQSFFDCDILISIKENHIPKSFRKEVKNMKKRRQDYGKGAYKK